MKKLEKLLTSESFIRYVYNTNEQDVLFWENWLQLHPEHEGVIERAKLAVQSLQFNISKQDDHDIEASWNTLQIRIRREAFSADLEKTKFFTPFKTAVAFSLCFILIITSYFLFQYQEKIILETGDGQELIFKFSDHSEVVLEENTRVYFSETWETDSVRQVWITGKAHFKVSKKKNDTGGNKRFEVITDQMLIDVIGTVFTVNTRSGPYVELKTGRVNVQLVGSDQIHKMVPGQVARLDQNSNLEILTEVVPNQLVFQDGYLNLTNHSFSEIIQWIETTYFVQINCRDVQLLDRKVSGQMKVENLMDLMMVLEKIFNISIVKKGDVLFIISTN